MWASIDYVTPNNNCSIITYAALIVSSNQYCTANHTFRHPCHNRWKPFHLDTNVRSFFHHWKFEKKNPSIIVGEMTKNISIELTSKRSIYRIVRHRQNSRQPLDNSATIRFRHLLSVMLSMLLCDNSDLAFDAGNSMIERFLPRQLSNLLFVVIKTEINRRNITFQSMPKWNENRETELQFQVDCKQLFGAVLPLGWRRKQKETAKLVFLNHFFLFVRSRTHSTETKNETGKETICIKMKAKPDWLQLWTGEAKNDIRCGANQH